jgi:multiple sugar transport system permease protein
MAQVPAGVAVPAARTRRRARWRAHSFPYLLLLPACIVLAALTLYPTLYAIYLSLCNLGIGSPNPTFIGITNYVNIAADPLFWGSLQISAIFTAVAVVVEFVLGFALALLLSQRLVGIRLMRTFLIVPMVMTPVIVALTWRMFYNPTYGVLNFLLADVGIHGPDWLSDEHTALASVILVDVWQWTPFMFLILTAGLHSLPGELYEAARVDGARGWQLFRYITVPLLRQVIVTALVFRLIDCFNTFDIIYVLTSGGPGVATQTLVIYSFFQSFRWFHFGYASALAVIILAILSAVSFVLVRLGGLTLLEVE